MTPTQEARMLTLWLIVSLAGLALWRGAVGVASGEEDAVKHCSHRIPPRLPYMASQADARRRMKRGERQRRCLVCGLWIWHEFWERPKRRPETETDSLPGLW